jgi:hypothetical protein
VAPWLFPRIVLYPVLIPFLALVLFLVLLLALPLVLFCVHLCSFACAFLVPFLVLLPSEEFGANCFSSHSLCCIRDPEMEMPRYQWVRSKWEQGKRKKFKAIEQ